MLGALLLGIAVVGALAAVVADGVRQDSAVAQTEPQQRTISVGGHGQVAITPDIAIVTVGSDTRDADLETALDLANQTADAIVAALQAAGIAENDIQTSGFSIWPEYNYENPDTQEITGYHVSHTFTVKVRAIDQAGAIVATAVDAGANQVQGIYFTTENPGASATQAREAALNDARVKAEDLARLANATLGEVVTISEYSYIPGPIPYASGAGRDAAEAAASAPNFQPGEYLVTIDLQVTWAMN
jgi:uncharacterized protein YggE